MRFAIANTKVYDSLGMGVPSGLMGRQLGTRPIFDSSMKGGSWELSSQAAGDVLIRNAKVEVIQYIGLLAEPLNSAK